MAKKFETKFLNVCDWCKIADYHWERLLGEFHNDSQFWEDLFHSMEQEDWWDVVDVARALQIEYPEYTDRYPNFGLNIDLVERTLHQAKLPIKPYNKTGFNRPATGLFMSVRDVINEARGTPTRTWTDKERAKILEERRQAITPKQQLFVVE